MSKKLANEWWYYANFGKVIKFVESIYPKVPDENDRIKFLVQEGRPTILKKTGTIKTK